MVRLCQGLELKHTKRGQPFSAMEARVTKNYETEKIKERSQPLERSRSDVGAPSGFLTSVTAYPQNCNNPPSLGQAPLPHHAIKFSQVGEVDIIIPTYTRSH